MKRKKINSKLENKIFFSNKINLLEINYGTILDRVGNLHRGWIHNQRVGWGEVNSLREKGSGGDTKGPLPFFCFSERIFRIFKITKN